MKRHLAVLAVAGMVSLAVAPLARAATIVHVIQEDPSAGQGIKRTALIVSPTTVKAGAVEFKIKNISRKLTHEVLVIKPRGKRSAMPYSEKQDRLIESKLDKLGDSGDQKPGQSYTMTVDMKPGEYLLLCNEPGHYKAGMWTWFHVTK